MEELLTISYNVTVVTYVAYSLNYMTLLIRDPVMPHYYHWKVKIAVVG